jgi:hypothetical protein
VHHSKLGPLTSATGHNRRLPQRNSNRQFTSDSGHHQHRGWEGALGAEGQLFNAPSACPVSRAGACHERVQNCPDLCMGPDPAPCCAHIALVKLCRNGVVARCRRAHDLLNDRVDIGRELARISLQGRHAAFCSPRIGSDCPRRCPRFLAAARAAIPLSVLDPHRRRGGASGKHEQLSIQVS